MPRTTPLAKTLFAVDELSGFIAACALVRPTGIEGMTPKSVRKKLKSPRSRPGSIATRSAAGPRSSASTSTEHVAFVIEAMAGRADELGLAPRPSTA